MTFIYYLQVQWNIFIEAHKKPTLNNPNAIKYEECDIKSNIMKILIVLYCSSGHYSYNYCNTVLVCFHSRTSFLPILMTWAKF